MIGRPLTIVIATYHGVGHVNSSLMLARPLRERGHRVIYYGLAAVRPLITAEGFEFVSLAEDLISEDNPLSRAQAGSWRARQNEIARAFDAFVTRCADGTIDRQLETLKPDIAVCDSLVWYVALRALKVQMPVVNFTTFLSGPPTPLVPPVTYGRVPRNTWWGRMEVRADWARLWLRRFIDFHLRPLVNAASVRYPARMYQYTRIYRRLARCAGQNCRKGIDYWPGFAGPHLRLPEIVLCPRPFEFAAAPGFGRQYVAGSINGGRTEDTALLDRLEPGKPVVYCSWGSESHVYPNARRLFQTVAEASRLRPDWQWILSVGPRFDATEFAAGPNLAVVNWAPQLALLRQAAAVMTHGGLNTVLECIHFGVPMVIVPGARDQPGNMARAVSHGVAVAARARRLRPARLVELIEQAAASQALRASLARPRGDCRARYAARRGRDDRANGAWTMTPAVTGLNLHFGRCQVSVRGDNGVLESLQRDFSWFTAEREPVALTITIEAPREAPDSSAIGGNYFFTHFNGRVYGWGNRRWVRYDDSLIAWDAVARAGRVTSLDPERLHHYTYYLIIAAIGKELDELGYHRFHSLGVMINGRAALFAMPISGGKTTLGLKLTEDTAVRLFSEDTPLIDRHGAVHASPVRLSVREGGPVLIPARFRRVKNDPIFGRKILVDLDYLGPDRTASAPGRQPLVFWSFKSQKPAPGLEAMPRWKHLALLVYYVGVGKDCPQRAEIFLRLSPGGIRMILTLLVRRTVAAWRLWRTSRAYRFRMSPDIAANARFIKRFIGGAEK